MSSSRYPAPIRSSCRDILSADSKGYGVKNVHQRIQLCYGEGYGLKYQSTPGCGTCVTLRIPQKIGAAW